MHGNIIFAKIIEIVSRIRQHLGDYFVYITRNRGEYLIK